MRKGHFRKNSVAFVCAIVSVLFFLVAVFSVIRLPEMSTENNRMNLFRTGRIRKVWENERVGTLGKMILEMLPGDLAFTVFVPSEDAFERDLRLRANESLAAEKANDTYAILTRILGFSAVPRKIPSASVPLGKEINFDSLSGFRLYIIKGSDGMLVVNGIRSERVDIKKGETVVHVMNGAIMDAEFGQSVQPDSR